MISTCKCFSRWFIRVYVFIPLLMMFSTAASAAAQPGDQAITLNERNATLYDVFKKIEKQTGLAFLYDASKVKDKQRVSINVTKIRLHDVLLTLLNERGLTFQFRARSIVLMPKTDSRGDGVGSIGDSATVSTVSVSGRIIDANGSALPGATIMVKGTRRGISSDDRGQFSLTSVPQNATLAVTLIGYKSEEVTLKGNSYVSIQLKQAVGDLDEAIVVAYNTTTLRNNTGAVTVLKGKQIQDIPNRSFDKSLLGMVPGLHITGGSGQPGSGLSNMVLRGITTGTDANAGQTFRNPLIVVDGVPVTQDYFQLKVGVNTTMITNPMAQLNTSDIETISVLKDAAAIALYGSKASNGVILVTTKKGKLGKTSFSFRSQTDMASRLKPKTKLLDQQAYLKLLYETYKNTDASFWTDQNITNDLRLKFPTYTSGTDTLFYSAPDWEKALFNGKALTTSNELSMSGGNESSRFYANLEFTKQDGIVRKTGYERKSLRFNYEGRPRNYIKIGLNTSLSHNIQNYSNATEGVGGFALGSVLSPLQPLRKSNGDYVLTYRVGGISRGTINPVAQAEYNTYRNTAYRGIAKLYGELSIMKYITVTSAIGADFMLAESKEKNDPGFYASSTSAPLPQITERDTRRISIINTNTVRVDKQVNKWSFINAIIGQESQIITQRILGASAVGNAQTLPYYNQINSPGYKMNAIIGQSSRQTLLSYFGQLNYAAFNKYFLTASLRRDGASAFGDQQRWGSYWSAGGGWLLSSESFMRSTASWLNFLKIRGSFGAAGNSGTIDPMTRFDGLTLYRYSEENAVVPQQTPGNSNIKWEKTFSWDAGLEMRIIKDRICVDVDYYKKNTSGMVYPIQLSSVSGYSSVLANIGDMENKGIEISLRITPITNEVFTWNVTGNWSSNKNRLVKANVALSQVSSLLLGNEEGRNFNSFYMPIWAGVNSQDGRPQWIDSKGLPTSEYNNALKQFVGKPQPDGFGSFTNTLRYKSFELSAMLYYSYGNLIYNSTLASPLLSDGIFPYVNQVEEATNYWRKPGDITPNPRRVLNNTDGGSMPSTRYLFKGDNIRLQNVSLSYSLSPQQTHWLNLTGFRIYVQANNLATITSYRGPNPDNVNVEGGTGFAYPNQRTYSAGVNINF